MRQIGILAALPHRSGTTYAESPYFNVIQIFLISVSTSIKYLSLPLPTFHRTSLSCPCHCLPCLHCLSLILYINVLQLSPEHTHRHMHRHVCAHTQTDTFSMCGGRNVPPGLIPWVHQMNVHKGSQIWWW